MNETTTICYTTEQQAIIEHSLSQHALVSAVAGSGKTQTLIARIEFLLKNAVNPSEILVLMFNKSAANDFTQRLNKLNINVRIDIKTFHALGLKTVSFLEQKGLLPAAQLIDRKSMLEKLVREALQKTNQLLNEKEPITPEIIDRYQQYIGLLKSSLYLKEMLKQVEPSEQSKVEAFFRFYEQLRAYYRWRTFDDLLYEPMKVLSASKALATRFGNRYRYVIVDEYQDINDVQQSLLKLISSNAQSVMAVGDIDQTIYEWRGSRPFYMLKGFVQDFKNAKTYTLSQTFRYGHLLSVMANEVIQHNKQRLKTLCFSAPAAAKKTDVNIISKNKLKLLIQEVAQNIRDGEYKPEEVTVLVRKYSSGVLLELSCLQEGLNYHIAGGQSVFKLPLTQSIFGYLSLVDQGKYFQRLPDQIRKEKVTQMLSFPSLYLNISQLEGLSELLCATPLNPTVALQNFKQHYDLPFYQISRVKERLELWQNMLDVKPKAPASTVMKMLYTLLDLTTYLAKKAAVSPVYTDSDVADAWLNFSLETKQTITDFLDHFNALQVQASLSKQDKNGLLISSIHKAKGLQWQHVILCDMTEQSFFSNSKDKPPTHDEIESERRLFYVAITRAISKLSIVAGNDVAKLNKWFFEGISGAPQGLRKTNSVRFLYESHLHQCEMLLKAHLDQDQIALKYKSKHSVPMANYLKKLAIVLGDNCSKH
ncbi:ATP-dependent helicase [Cysteiniphilum halobium]|uniref:ATP-dependent helicase n=1 Tax=Cysteiniphilum halobium TaxID=2219059 RepID=UPI003F849054